MTNFQVGDKITICKKEYTLEQRFSGGFQFRTWLVVRNGKRYVAKITDKMERFLRELRAYVHLKTNSRYPDRYYSELIAIDYEAKLTKKNGSETGNFNAILLKHYRNNDLNEFMEHAPEQQKRLTVDKLRRRVEKLHHAGLCHGDLRESNIIVTKTRRGLGVRLIDFGLSSFCTDKAIRKEDKKLNKIVAGLRE